MAAADMLDDALHPSSNMRAAVVKMRDAKGCEADRYAVALDLINGDDAAATERNRVSYDRAIGAHDAYAAVVRMIDDGTGR